MPACSPPSRVPAWLAAGRPPWLSWPLPQLGPGSASNPGQAQPVGSARGLLGRPLSPGRAEPAPRREHTPVCYAGVSGVRSLEPHPRVSPGHLCVPLRATPQRRLRCLPWGQGRVGTSCQSFVPGFAELPEMSINGPQPLLFRGMDDQTRGCCTEAVFPKSETGSRPDPCPPARVTDTPTRSPGSEFVRQWPVSQSP